MKASHMKFFGFLAHAEVMLHKQDVVCVCVCVCVYIFTMEYFLAIQKNEIMPFAVTWMDLEIVILSDVSQTEKGKHHTISILCRILKMVQMSLCTEQK